MYSGDVFAEPNGKFDRVNGAIAQGESEIDGDPFVAQRTGACFRKVHVDQNRSALGIDLRVRGAPIDRAAHILKYLLRPVVAVVDDVIGDFAWIAGIQNRYVILCLPERI